MQVYKHYKIYIPLSFSVLTVGLTVGTLYTIDSNREHSKVLNALALSIISGLASLFFVGLWRTLQSQVECKHAHIQSHSSAFRKYAKNIKFE